MFNSMSKKFLLKNDAYRKNRGGYSRFLNILCEGCGTHLLFYQKDGSGELKRMYLDRIISPKILSSKKRGFTCHSCKRVIGIFYIYAKEKRPAIRLYQGSVLKKIVPGDYSALKH